MKKPTHLVAHLQFFQPHKAKQKTAKEPSRQCTKTRQKINEMNR